MQRCSPRFPRGRTQCRTRRTSSAASAIVVHSGGEVLYEKNADAQSLIASTTKLMTAIVAIENCGLDDEVEVGAESCGIEGSSMYLHPGQCVHGGGSAVRAAARLRQRRGGCACEICRGQH
ncbi:MAG: hypothetical protein V8S72_09635 [Oscillospiraceae bacterium]